jgi:hypothetical protein
MVSWGCAKRKGRPSTDSASEVRVYGSVASVVTRVSFASGKFARPVFAPNSAITLMSISRLASFRTDPVFIARPMRRLA